MSGHVCRYCHQAVADGAPVHGLTGDHWECCENARKLLEAFTRRAGYEGPPRVVRANGGLRVHVQRENSDAALCGIVPSNKRGNGKMRRRGYWVPLKYTLQDFRQMRTTEGATIGGGPRACVWCKQVLTA